MYQWREVDQYRASLPAHAIEGGAAFSLNFFPWLFTFCSIGLGIIAVALLAISFITRYLRRQSPITFFHISAVLALLPFLYLSVRVAMVFLR